MKRYRFLTAEEERELFRRYRECGDQEACTALINSQTALAYGITKERTRQIVRDSLVKMRRFLAEGDLPRNHG